jgi:hypothetical protein
VNELIQDMTDRGAANNLINRRASQPNAKLQRSLARVSLDIEKENVRQELCGDSIGDYRARVRLREQHLREFTQAGIHVHYAAVQDLARCSRIQAIRDIAPAPCHVQGCLRVDDTESFEFRHAVQRST